MDNARCLLLALLAVQNLGKEEKAMFRAHSDACMSESHVEPNILENLLKGHLVDDPALRRHVYCVLLKCKLIGKDGKMQKAAVLGKLATRNDGRNITKVLESCADQPGDNPEDLAWNLFRCGYDKKAAEWKPKAIAILVGLSRYRLVCVARVDKPTSTPSLPRRCIAQRQHMSRDMLPEAAEVMRRAACGDLCPAPAPQSPTFRSSENKELLRQQLLAASKDRSERVEPKAKSPRNRQKNRWKLKFHHQALPQEYLDHYEQTLKASAKKKSQDKPKEQTDVTSEAFKLWAQRLAGVQPDETLNPPRASDQTGAKTKEEKKKKPANHPSKVMTYENLPYMGEMTLNNSKPRRGRKPKKADICHLIYENYGTVVPGQPPPQDKLNSNLCNSIRTETPVNTSKTDLQNKIITSLLERKLSQESKRRLENPTPPRFCSPDEPMPEAPLTTAGPLHSDDEPLNLCIRDLHDLKIQIRKKFGNIYSSIPDIKSEAIDEEEGRKSEQPNAISVIQRNTNVPHTASSSPDLSHQTRNVSPTLSEPARSSRLSPEDDKFPGYVYWPNAGIYMHPLALQTQLLYYQRLAAAGRSPIARDKDGETSGTKTVEDKTLDENKNKLVLKQISELLDPKMIKDATKGPEPATKRTSPNPQRGPVKRKRSAIFIPPMPVKTNTSTPTAEVSICKFKFTGGSKPSLQEKKMLSVDSGGNFRYYSGTGSKNSKAYDYIQKNSEEHIGFSEPTLLAPASDGLALKDELSKKKRKSRKTLQREKLEQTFKEKGFLIQTQQLQSAEGATYCKFRQLRKFTRYLFRSWKDYLPGELDEKAAQQSQERPQPPPADEASSDWR
ncbi:unnamed protein product [Leptosia nina]|uniref:Uncharacterized protein n=1 Tax=Leptosia nina TaxID=320188 RepID=A0AAV1JA65_9NEOP